MASETLNLNLSVEKNIYMLESAKVNLMHFNFEEEQAEIIAWHVNQFNVK